MRSISRVDWFDGFDQEEHHNISGQHLNIFEVSDMGGKLDILFSPRNYTEKFLGQGRLDAGFGRLLMQGSKHRVSRVVKTIFLCFGDQCFGDRCGFTIIYTPNLYAITNGII